MSVEFSPLAGRDLEEIADHIARDSPRRALSFVDEIEALCRSLDQSPARYEAADHVAAGLRRAVHGRYLIFYTTKDRDVRIERVLHGAREIRDDDFEP